jgi:hypothetical protein
MSNYIYIIKTAESIQKNDNVYKVGMTRLGLQIEWLVMVQKVY